MTSLDLSTPWRVAILVACLPISQVGAQGPKWTSQSRTVEPPGRVGHAMAYDAARQRVVLFGGNAHQRFSQHFFSDTWEWDGSAWTELQPATVPPSFGGTMVYDAARQQLLLWTGSALWTWDGTDWSTVPAAISPPPGTAALAYDAARQLVVLFGAGATENETWEWDGTAWTQRFPMNNPPRFYTGTREGMAYDDSLGMCVLDNHDATWFWDGTNWSSMFTGGQTTNRAIAFDRVRERLVQFGGNLTTYYGGWTSETRELVGGTWVVRSPSTRPQWRTSAVAVWDDARGEVFMFGGGTFDRALLYEYWPGAWTYQTENVGAFTPLGNGCPGTAGTPRLTTPSPPWATAPVLPWAGSPFTVDLRRLPPGNATALLFGISSTQWGGLMLPLDLAFLGMTGGCSLQVSGDFVMPLANPLGTSSLTLLLPANLPPGGEFHLQALVADPGANPLGATVSGGATVTVGAR